MRHKLLMFNKNIMEEKRMKKILFVLALALVLIGGFATAVLADESHITDPGAGNFTAPSHGGTVWLQMTNGVANNIHSDYTVNTDACASCHSVHNGQDADGMLLQWTSISETCMACHDGTVTTTYDVVNGHIGSTGANTFGGKFAQTAGGVSASQHNVGIATMSAVPGGNPSGTADGWGTWGTGVLECSSCHDPHGVGGNARILNPNPNGAVKQVQKAAIPDSGAGVYKFSSVTVSTNPAIVTVTTSATTQLLTTMAVADFTAPYNKKLPNIVEKLTIFNAAGADVTTSVTKIVPTNNGTAKDLEVYYAAGAGNPIYVTYTPFMQVAATINPAAKLTSAETVKWTAGMTEFCSACHTDYYGPRTNATTKLPEPKRAYETTEYHHTGNLTNGTKNYTELGNAGAGTSGNCLTCHYAHGVDQSIWDVTKNTNGSLKWVNKTEVAGSSALKRLPNMGTCETCHSWEAKAYNTTNDMSGKYDGSRWRFYGN
jgi:predicted CXXCH cytochrome family protein